MKRFIATIAFVLATLSALPMAGAQPRETPSQPGQVAAPPPAPAGQVVFLIDHSGSMTERAFGSDGESRWDVVQRAIPEWLNRLGANTPVGVATVGGRCGGPPVAWSPARVDRAGVEAVLARLSPGGETPLNAVLERVPELFAPGEGPRKLVLLSDGGNTCAPLRNTCEIARELYARHRISIEVVAFVTDPALAAEFTCIAKVTHGSFNMPATMKGWTDLRLSGVDPWPAIVFGLGLAAALATCLVLYRQANRAARSSVRVATVLAAGFLLASAATLALHLLFNLSTLAALIGAVLVVGGAWLMWHRLQRHALAGVLLGLIALGIGAAPDVRAQAPVGRTPSANVAACKADRDGPPLHHVLVIDVSGSVYQNAPGNFAAITNGVTVYLCRYARTGDTVSIVTFGSNERSAVEEVALFDMPATDAPATIARALQQVRLPSPAVTQTYFRMLRDYLDQRLRQMRRTPVVLIFSDGQSDDPANPAEPAYGAFGRLYPLANAPRVRVAYRGPVELEPAEVLSTPLPAAKSVNVPAIAPCLIDPQVTIAAPARIELTSPWWDPRTLERRGTLSVTLTGECVDRLRKVALRLEHERGQIALGSFEVVLGPQPRVIELLVNLATVGDLRSIEGSLVAIVNPGTRSERRIAAAPTRISIELASWLDAHGMLAALGAVGGFCCVALVAGLLLIVARRVRRRPLVIKTIDGAAAALDRGALVGIGGPGAVITLPDAPAGHVFATAIWDGNNDGALSMTSEAGVRMAVNGVESVGVVRYALGQALRFTPPGASRGYDVTLLRGAKAEMALTEAASGLRPSLFDVGEPPLGMPSSSSLKI